MYIREMTYCNVMNKGCYRKQRLTYKKGHKHNSKVQVIICAEKSMEFQISQCTCDMIPDTISMF